LILLALLWTAIAGDPCPDFRGSVENAEKALSPLRIDALSEYTLEAQRGLACGPIATKAEWRARFWLVLSVMLDNSGDRSSVDDALSAAWRAWPNVSVRRLPSHLQNRYAELTEVRPEEASFRLLPLPDREAIIYVDGRATRADALHSSLEADAALKTKAGLHIIQLAENIDLENATAGGVRDLQSGEVEIFDINNMALFGRSSASSIQLPGRVRAGNGPQGGCAGR
jgi:hypothetical protein